MSLFDSSNKGVKFTNIGDQVTGTVTGAPYERQQTKYGSQEPDFWPDGNPKMQILVPLQTTLRDDQNDDGERTLYVASKHMKQAIGAAIREAGASDIVKGGTLTVQYTGNDPASKNPANPAKLYTARYTAPAGAFAQQAAPAPTQQPVPATTPGYDVAPGFAPSQPAPVPQQPAQIATAAPVQQPAPIAPAPQPPAQPAPAAPAATAGLTAQQLAQLQQLRAAGIADETVATAIGATLDQVQSIPF